MGLGLRFLVGFVQWYVVLGEKCEPRLTSGVHDDSLLRFRRHPPCSDGVSPRLVERPAPWREDRRGLPRLVGPHVRSTSNFTNTKQPH